MTIPDDTTAKLSRMVFGCLLVGVLCLPAVGEELTPRQLCNIGCYVECADEEGSLDIACVNACKAREDCDNLPGGTTALPWLVGESRPATVTKCEARADALLEAKQITEGQHRDAIAACHGWDTRKLPEGNEVAQVLDDGSPFKCQLPRCDEPKPLTMLALYLSRVVL